MRTYWWCWSETLSLGFFTALSVILGCSTNPYSQYLERLSSGSDIDAHGQQVIKRSRRQEPVKTPEWVNAIPDRVADILIKKHLYRNGPVWGTARSRPQQELPYDEMGSATFFNLVRQYGLFDTIGGWDDKKRQEALSFWQGWQDPETGRFKDPRDPNRLVNEKYVVGLIRNLGGEPLYPWTTTGTDKKIETDVFLRRTKTDPDWQRGGWAVGSHTGFMAVEIFEAINAGQSELIPDLKAGIERILTHQDLDSGLWGPPSAELLRRMGGTLKIVGRLYFKLGMTMPHTRALADCLIENHRNGRFYAEGCGDNPCLARNVAEVAAYCLEVSDYRKDELFEVLEGLAHEYRRWVLPDGTTLTHRDQPDSVGIQYTTMYGLGIIGAYLHWQDCRLPNPLGSRHRGLGYRYKVAVQEGGTVKIIDTKPSNKAQPDR